MAARPETAQTLDRGLLVLQALGAPRNVHGLSMSELAERLGLARTVVYRLVTTLEARGFVSRGEDGRVRLGLGVARLQYAVRPVLVEVARPVLHELAEQSGATAHLTLADGEHAVALLVVEPTWTDFHVAYRVGSRHPLERGAAGRAILEGRRGTLDGATTTTGELQLGAHGVAAAVPGVPGLEASVGVVTMGPPPPVEELVLAAALRLGRLLAGPATG
ncbi:IclR family transcriptional regulator [Ornithinimicrobium avium]|uniref:IclR family transcriptional regulator n=1 Tax=Ornithinimicrobium avium TaxID=2283195 RepID=A0A345NII1_9MICO|nr:helix-turn-helix domain-containing protein [Ornithinimicrobium avium]AXH94839.1 IclR family transcriptional regulator [Ornithinimicrobium avium]